VVAWIRHAQGDAAGALEAMDDAGRAGLSPQVVALLNPVPSQRARLLLAQGDVHAAAQWTTAARRRAALLGGATPGIPRPVNAPNAEDKTMQLEIDAAKEAAPEWAAVETRGLTKRYRSAVALDGCTITVPRGRISALIGPNGAGKTTLLRILCGLARPSGGSVSVLGHTPGQGDTGFLAEVGFLAQDIPLYWRLTAEDHIAVGAHVNARFDGESVRARMHSLGIPLDRAAGKLSGGQRTQLALALTLAKNLSPGQ
jgi:ABC-type glutathione transport system ATPase component